MSGLSRLLRSNALAALENQALWHERDISHSSVERVIMPDSTILADYVLTRLARLLSGLVVKPERMRENMERSFGLYFSQRVLTALIAAGLPRQQAYEAVQRLAMQSWKPAVPSRTWCGRTRTCAPAWRSRPGGVVRPRPIICNTRTPSSRASSAPMRRKTAAGSTQAGTQAPSGPPAGGKILPRGGFCAGFGPQERLLF